MIGNCAHCHNPRGYPSVTQAGAADRRSTSCPAPSDGGIFELALGAHEPDPRARRQRRHPDPVHHAVAARLSGHGHRPAPHRQRATPSPRALPPALRREQTWTPKYDSDRRHAHQHVCAAPAAIRSLRAYCGTRRTGYSFVPAPWRSLIYRNVDTPFPYFDDYVPFPHMPMNTSGFDCRAPRIMGDWMVGLPASRKFPRHPRGRAAAGRRAIPTIPTYDRSPQPYQQVMPDDPGYADALVAAQGRLDEYHVGVRYNYCETVLSPDILDPITPPSSPQYKPNPIASNGGYLYGGTAAARPAQPERLYPASDRRALSQPFLPVRPDRFAAAVDPAPRGLGADPGRASTRQGVAGRRFPAHRRCSPTPAVCSPMRSAKRRRSFRQRCGTIASTALPYGLWQVKPECQQTLASMPPRGQLHRRPIVRPG